MNEREKLIKTLVNRIFYFKTFERINAPRPFLKHQREAIKKARRKLNGYERKYGKISETEKRNIYLEYLNELLGDVILSQLKPSCENCVHLYERNPWQGDEECDKNLEIGENASDSRIETLLNDSLEIMERGCSLYGKRPEEMSSSTNCKYYSPISENAEEYDKRLVEVQVRIIKEMMKTSAL
ncbi:MAG: hypothetical protein QW622_02250 [Candidatus Pacearchaeota archaeon]